MNETLGFFQCPFVKAITDWNIGTDEERSVIAENKTRRDEFSQLTDEIIKYCKLECRLLAMLMTEFRVVCSEAGISPQEWRGAGWLASALLKKHGVARRPDRIHSGSIEILLASRLPAALVERLLRAASPAGPFRVPLPGRPSLARGPLSFSGYQGLYSDLQDVPRELGKLAAEGVAYYRTKIEGLPAPSGDNRYSLFGETSLHGFVQWVGEPITIKTPELKRVPIGAAMFGTFCKNESEARKFWAEVARGGVEYEDSHPTTVLDAWLKASTENKSQKRELKPRIFIRAASSRGMLIVWAGPSRRLSSTPEEACSPSTSRPSKRTPEHEMLRGKSATGSACPSIRRRPLLPSASHAAALAIRPRQPARWLCGSGGNTGAGLSSKTAVPLASAWRAPRHSGGACGRTGMLPAMMPIGLRRSSAWRGMQKANPRRPDPSAFPGSGTARCLFRHMPSDPWRGEAPGPRADGSAPSDRISAASPGPARHGVSESDRPGRRAG